VPDAAVRIVNPAPAILDRKIERRAPNVEALLQASTIDHSAIPAIADGGMTKNQVLRFGLPKGSLQDATLEKMAKAGWNISVSSRSYIPYVDDDELAIRMIRSALIFAGCIRGHINIHKLAPLGFPPIFGQARWHTKGESWQSRPSA